VDALSFVFSYVDELLQRRLSQRRLRDQILLGSECHTQSGGDGDDAEGTETEHCVLDPQTGLYHASGIAVLTLSGRSNSAMTIFGKEVPPSFWLPRVLTS
jgi:hypothetical protein